MIVVSIASLGRKTVKVRIDHIADRGVVNKERLYLRVFDSTDLSFYVVFNTTYTEMKAISNNPKNVYWFPSAYVKPGDMVVLYSGFGQNRSFRVPDGTMNHSFHWGQKNTLWNGFGDCAVLLEIESWQTSPLE
jgi:hypothetical protein